MIHIFSEQGDYYDYMMLVPASTTKCFRWNDSFRMKTNYFFKKTLKWWWHHLNNLFQYIIILILENPQLEAWICLVSASWHCFVMLSCANLRRFLLPEIILHSDLSHEQVTALSLYILWIDGGALLSCDCRNFWLDSKCSSSQ